MPEHFGSWAHRALRRVAAGLDARPPDPVEHAADAAAESSVRPALPRCGGILGGRARDPLDEFENAVEAALGERMRADRYLAKDVWRALVNVIWTRVDGAEARYTMRGAGDLVAAIVGSTDYLDFYMCGEPIVIPEVSDAMALQGWRPVASASTEWRP